MRSPSLWLVVPLFALGLLSRDAQPAIAAGAQATGGGVTQSPGPTAAFSVDLDDDRPASFSYWDYATDPPRTFGSSDRGTADCLGELFGGQTLRLSTSGFDSSYPNESLTLQLFMVDGGAAGPDRFSLKVLRTDGSITYFAPLRNLESGDLSVSCG